MSDSRVESLMKMAEAAFTRFEPWRQLSQDIAANFYPMRADFTQSLQLQDFASDLMDGSPLSMRENLGNAIDAMLRQGQWFHVGTGDRERDDRPGNKVGLNRATDVLSAIIKNRKSNWRNATKEADMDWCSFGGCVMSVEEAPSRDHVMFRAWHPKDCAWNLDENGRLYCFYRKMQMSARNILKKVESGVWKGAVSQNIREAVKLDPGKEFPLMHVLMRADDLYAASYKDQKRIRHEYISIYMDCENRTYLNELGSPVFNYVAPRMRTMGNLPFGFSPMALNSIADARMLQDMSLVILEQGQKAVDPPTIGAGSVFTRDLKLFAGGHTEVDLDEGRRLQDVFTTVDTGERINVGLELKADVRALIADAWLMNKLMLPSLRDMREVEVMVRTEEFRRAALPFFQPIESNYHSELLGVAFDVATNARMISPEMFPPELRGHDIDFTFDSPLNEAEGKLIVDKYFTAINIVAAMEPIDPSAKNLFKIRKAAEEALSFGGKAEWIATDEERAALDEQAQQESDLAKGAEIARQAAGVIADTSNASMAAQAAGLAPQPA